MYFQGQNVMMIIAKMLNFSDNFPAKNEGNNIPSIPPPYSTVPNLQFSFTEMSYLVFGQFLVSIYNLNLLLEMYVMRVHLVYTSKILLWEGFTRVPNTTQSFQYLESAERVLRDGLEIALRRLRVLSKFSKGSQRISKELNF